MKTESEKERKKERQKAEERDIGLLAESRLLLVHTREPCIAVYPPPPHTHTQMINIYQKQSLKMITDGLEGATRPSICLQVRFRDAVTIQ